MWPRLAKDAERHLQVNSAVTVADLEKSREEFIILLLRLSDVDNGKQILYLLKLAAHIRGPLRARSVELVKMVFRLNEFVNNNKSNGLLHHTRSDLKKLAIPSYLSVRNNANDTCFRLFAESIATMEGTKSAVADIKRITLVSDEYKEQESKLNDILGKIALAYSTVGVSFTQTRTMIVNVLIILFSWEINGPIIKISLAQQLGLTKIT